MINLLLKSSLVAALIITIEGCNPLGVTGSSVDSDHTPGLVDNTPVVGPSLASVTITSGNPTNNQTLSLTYGAITNTYVDYCILENSTDVTTCSWVTGTLPSTFSVNTTNEAKVLSIWLRDADSLVSPRVASASLIFDNVVPTLASASVSNSSPTNTQTYGLTFGALSETVGSYCILENDTTFANCTFTAGTLPSSFNVSATEGAKVLSVWIKDAAGNVSTRVNTGSVTLDTTVPVLASVAIGNASPTNSQTYTLSYGAITGTYDSYCILENSTTVDSCTFTAGTLPASYSVTATNNAKTLSFWLKDAAGNLSTRVDSSAVTLDTVVPVLASATIGNANPTNTQTFTLTYGTQTGSYSDYCILENDTDVTNCSYTASTLPSSYSVTATNGAKVLSIWLKDAAGNVSTRVDSGSVTLDTVAPILASATIGNTNPTNSQAYTLTYTGISGTYASYCILENSTTLASCTFTAGTLPASYSVAATNGAKVLSVWLKDAAGNISSRVDTGSVTLDTVAPVLASVAIGNSSPTNSQTYTLTFGAITGSYDSYCILENSTNVSSCTFTVGTVPASFSVSATNNAKTLSVWLKDSAGNISTRVDTGAVTLDNVAPVLASASVTNADPSATQTFGLSFGTVSASNYSSYCILENDTTVGDCAYTVGTLPASFNVNATEGAKVLSIWLKDDVGNVSTRVDTASINLIYNPVVGSIDVPSGAVTGGTVINITGTGFVPDSAVTIGGDAVTCTTTFNSSTSLTCTTTESNPGLRGVRVTNTNYGHNHTLVNAFTYETRYANSTYSAIGSNIGGPNGNDEASKAIAKDSDGNIYVVGNNHDDLGNGHIGGDDGFLAKYDSSGRQIFIKNFGTIDDDHPTGITITGSGTSSSIWVTGYSNGDFGGHFTGDRHGFLVQFNTSGNPNAHQNLVNIDDGFEISPSSITHDDTGNIYITGYTTGSFRDTSLDPNLGSGDIFLMKFDASGAVQYKNRYGTTGEDHGNAIAYDSIHGQIWITGYTTGDFGNGNLGGNDAFILAVNKDSGSINVAKNLGSIGGDDYGNSIAVDSTGRVWITGSTDGDFGNGNIGSSKDGFIARYSSVGSLEMVKNFGTSADEYANSIQIDSSGIPTISGITHGRFGSASCSTDVFIAKFDELGNRIFGTNLLPQDCREQVVAAMILDSSDTPWIVGNTSGTWSNKNFGGTDGFLLKAQDGGISNVVITEDDQTSAAKTIAIDSLGNHWIAGNTAKYIGGFSNGSYDFYVAKTDSKGNLLFVNRYGLDGSRELVSQLAVDSNDHIWITGSTDGNFGNTNNGGTDGFLMQLNQSGAVLSTVSFGTTGEDFPKAIAIAPNGKIWITGSTDGDFGNTNQGGRDGFIARFSSAGVFESAQNFGTTGDDLPSSISINSSNEPWVSGGSFEGDFGHHISNHDDFVVHFDASMNILYSQNIVGNTVDNYTSTIKVDHDDKVWISGYTEADINSTSLGVPDAYLVKLNSSGTSILAKSISTPNRDFGTGLAIDSDNNPWITGFTDGDFGNSAKGGVNAFYAKLETSGITNFSTNVGFKTVNEDYSYAIALDSSNHPWIAGNTDSGWIKRTGSSDNLNGAFIYRGLASANILAAPSTLTSTFDGDKNYISFQPVLGAVDYALYYWDASHSTWEKLNNGPYTTLDDNGLCRVQNYCTFQVIAYTDSQTYSSPASTSYTAHPSYPLSLDLNHGPSTSTTRINLTGNHFDPGTKVTIGGQECSIVALSPPSSITCDAHSYSPGTFDVQVLNPDSNTTEFLASGFTYESTPPSLAYQYSSELRPHDSITATTTINAITHDSSGNIWVGGKTDGKFDSGGSYSDQISFFAKYDPDGNLLFGKNIDGGAGLQGVINGITIDSNGAIWVCGSTLEDLGGGNAGGLDAFIAKLDSSGNILFSKNLGTSHTDEALGIAIDSDNNAWITGYTKAGINGTSNLGGNDAFIAKYNNAGTLLMAKNIGTTGDERANGIAIDKTNSIHNVIWITGETNGDFGHAQSEGHQDPFLVKLNSNADIEFSLNLGAAQDDYATGIAVRPDGKVYITGSTLGDMGDGQNGGKDIYLALINPDGSINFQKNYGTAGNEFANGISIDSHGFVWLTGVSDGADWSNGVYLSGANQSWVGMFTADGTQLGINGIPNNNPEGVFSNAIDVDANDRVWAAGRMVYGSDNPGFLSRFVRSNQPAYKNDSFIKDMAIDSSGNTWVVGQTRGDVGGAAPNGMDTNNGWDGFVSKFDSTGNLIFSRNIGTTAYDLVNGIAISDSGQVWITGTSEDDMGGAGADRGHTLPFIAKLDSNGFVTYSRNINVSGNNVRNGSPKITIDHLNHPWVVYSDNDTDVMLMSFDVSGITQFSKKFISMRADLVSAITTDSHNQIYVVGTANGDFLTHSGIGSKDLFLIKMASDGEVLLQQNMGTTDSDTANSVAVDSAGKIWITGTTQGMFDHRDFSSDNAFVMKLNEDGSQVFAKNLPIPKNSFGNGIAIDPTNGDAIIVGRANTENNTGSVYAAGGVNFDTAKGFAQGFTIKMSSDGNTIKFAQNIGMGPTQTVSIDLESVKIDSSGHPRFGGFAGHGAFAGPKSNAFDFFISF